MDAAYKISTPGRHDRSLLAMSGAELDQSGAGPCTVFGCVAGPNQPRPARTFSTTSHLPIPSAAD